MTRGHSDRERARRRAENARRYRPAHEMLLEDFLPRRPIIAESRITPGSPYDAFIKKAENNFRGFFRKGSGIETRESHLPGVDLHIRESRILSSLMLTDRQSGKSIAGIFNGTPFCPEEERGKGYGAELVLATFSDPELIFLNPISYSESGYGARLSAHRIGVERAHEAGLEVPEENLDRYGLTKDVSEDMTP